MRDRDYDFGNLIYTLRKKRNLTQSQLGGKLGVSDKAVSKWENGVTKPSTDMLYKLADFFEVSVDELVSGKLMIERDEKKVEKGDRIKRLLDSLKHKTKTVCSNIIHFFISHKKSILKYSAITLVSVVVVGMACLLLYFHLPVAVPDVVGKEFHAACGQIETCGFQATVAYEYSDTVPKNRIISQDVASGTKIKRNSTINVSVSKGVEQIQVPDVENMTVAEAEKRLTDLGFVVEYSEKFSDTVEKGTVMFQTAKPNRKKNKGSKIGITVSKGMDLVAVPNVIGKTRDSAIQALRQQDLEVVTDIQCSNSVKEGRVLRQSVDAGQPISRGSTVTVTVSAGVANTVGNTNSNLVKFGRVAKQGDWVYYINWNYNNYLYKMRSDGSEKQVLTKDYACEINVVGEWVYYVNPGGASGSGGGIYKIQLDGSHKTKLSGLIPDWMMVVGDEIYYVVSYKGGPVSKMSTDGSNTTIVCNDTCRQVNLIGDWLFYINGSDKLVYKARTDGTGRKVVNATAQQYTLCGENDYLFSEDHYDVFRMSTTDNECISFKGTTNFQRSYLNYENGWVYYIGLDLSDFDRPKAALYKMKPDTTQATKLLDIKYPDIGNNSICVAGGWVYFSNGADHHYLYRIRTDGSGLQKIYN